MKKTCNGCKLHNNNMAMIPYIEHMKALYKAHQINKNWVWAFVVSNCLWFLGVVLYIVGV